MSMNCPRGGLRCSAILAARRFTSAEMANAPRTAPATLALVAYLGFGSGFIGHIHPWEHRAGGAMLHCKGTEPASARTVPADTSSGAKTWIGRKAVAKARQLERPSPGSRAVQAYPCPPRAVVMPCWF